MSESVNKLKYFQNSFKQDSQIVKCHTPTQTYQAIRSKFDCWRTLRSLSLAPSALAGTAAVFRRNRKLCSRSPKCTSPNTEGWF